MSKSSYNFQFDGPIPAADLPGLLVNIGAMLTDMAGLVEATSVTPEPIEMTPEPVTPPAPPNVRAPLAWGAKVSPLFRERVWWLADTLAAVQKRPFDPNWVMGVMAWESGRSFSASKKNLAGSGATGLIQFMPATAIDLGRYRKVTLTTDILARMTPEDQLSWVYWYFHQKIAQHGAITNLEDCYMAVLWPAAIGKPVTAPLWDKKSRPTTYRQNEGLDLNDDNIITKLEAATKVRETLAEGLKFAA